MPSVRHGQARRLLFGSAGGIARTVHGTIVVMATVTVGSHDEDPDAWRNLLLGLMIVGLEALVAH